MRQSSAPIRYVLLTSLVLCLLSQWIYSTTAGDETTGSLASFLEARATDISKTIDDLGPTALDECPASAYFGVVAKDSNGNAIYWNDASAATVSTYQTPYAVLTSESGTKTFLYELSTKADSLSEYLDITNRGSTPYSPLRWVILLTYILFYFLALQVILRYCSIKSIPEAYSYLIVALTSFLLICIASTLYLPSLVSLDLQWSGSITYGLCTPLLVAISLAVVAHYRSRQTTPDKVALSLVSFIATGAAVASLIVLKTKLIQDVIDSSIVDDGISLPLQYQAKGVLFIAILLLLSILSFYISTIVTAPASHSADSKKKYIGLALGLGVALALALLLQLDIPLAALAAYIVSYLLIMDIYIESKSKSAIFLFLWMMIYSGFIASTCFHYILKEDMTTRQRFADDLYQTAHPEATDKAMSIDDAIKQSTVFSQVASLPFPARLDRSDFLSFFKEELEGKLDTVQVSVECYETGGSTLFKNHFANYAQTGRSLALSKKISEHVYYSPFEQCYYLNYQIQNDSYRSSPLQLVVRLATDEIKELGKVENFGYTVKRNNEILLHSTPASASFDVQRLTDIATAGTEKDYNYVISNPSSSITIYTYRKLEGLLKPISLFSFTMTLLALMLLIMALINNRHAMLPKEIGLNFDHTSSLRNRIQFTIIALTIFSFMLIGLMTIIYFKNVLEKQQIVKKEQQISSVINNIQSSIDGTAEAISLKNILSTQLDKLSHIHNKALSLYDQSGRLVATSSPSPSYQRLPFTVYKKMQGVLPSYHVDYRDDRLQQVSHFVSLLGNDNTPLATLQIPDDYDSLYSNSILDFLSTILNVYIFLFLVAGTIAVAISNSITKPLARLSEKLKLYKLGTTNLPLKWHTKDEIGSLIANYNELTKKLDESVSILAKTERDIAWREMAKQVAHEIKNPLTPMKLSIQHLQRLSNAEGIDMQQRVIRISKTLLEQFNNLDQIANSFSNFASMPKASNEKVMINEVVEAVHDLFRKREDMEISLSEPINDMYVYADRNHLVRVLNNIVKNAIQAIPTDKLGRIHISLEQKGTNAVVTVADNGVGIPDHMRDKVFTPNFTTKNSGTGLGLAISANMIEAFNGRIYFNTTPGKGTDFIIEVPLMRLEQHFDNPHRVELD